MKWFVRIIGIVVLVLAASACHQNGTVFAVDTTFDTVDSNPGDGFCNDANGECSLRAAVMEANALPGVEEIRLADGATYALTIPGIGENAAATGDLDIRSGVVITGDSVLTGTIGEVLLHLNGPGGIELDGLDLAATTFGIRVEGASTAVMIRDSDLFNVPNWIEMLSGTLIIDAASHDSNYVAGPLIDARGGSLTMLNVSARAYSTLVRATDATVNIQHSTFARADSNAFVAVAGGSGVITVGSSYIHGGCAGSDFVSAGYNAARRSCQQFNDTNDIENAWDALDPDFTGSLRDNRGPVRTFLVPAGSALVDAAAPSGCSLGVDARDEPRPFGTACDIGAMEIQPSMDCEARGQDLSFRHCDFSNVDLGGEDLSGGDFLGAALLSTNLREADLSESDLSGAFLFATVLDGASLRDATIGSGGYVTAGGTDFSGAAIRGIEIDDAVGAIFVGATLDDVDFDSRLDGVDFSQSSVTRTTIGSSVGSSFRDAVFVDSPIRNPIGADLRGFRAIGAYISGDMSGANLDGADLSRTNVVNHGGSGIIGTPAALPPGVLLEQGYVIGPGSWFQSADLSGRDLRAARMSNVRGQFSNFSEAILPVDMKSSDFRWADFSGAELVGVDAYNTSFRDSQFVDVNARDGVFVYGWFQDSTIVGVDFTGADLTNATFTNALMLWNTFDNTTCPTGVISNDNGGSCDGQFGFGQPQDPGAPVPVEFQGREAEFTTLGGN